MPAHSPKLAFAMWLGTLTVVGLSPAGAQDATPQVAVVSGSVSALATGTPLPGALVMLIQRSNTDSIRFAARTNRSGRYALREVPWGAYVLRVSAPGFREQTVDLDVAAPSAGVSVRLLTEVTAPAMQDSSVAVSGLVLESGSDRALARATVSVEGTALEVLTDQNGRYRLVGVPPGPQVIRARLIGYAPTRVALVIPVRGQLTRDIRLAANPLMLEGVVVTADALGRAEGELGTASVIDREAIQHQTATSLSGVLELAPGVPVRPPGLDDIQQIALRSVPTSGTSLAFNAQPGATRAQDLASFSTLIVLDGIPITNNANLQSLGPLGELSLPSSAGGGIDLRQVPAATLERVEVIRGVPSARWGDLTQGAIVVETRAGAVDPEVKAHLDARTGEIAVLGGRALGPIHTGTGTFDFAGTRTAPGRADDYAYRVAAQAMHRADLGESVARLAAPKLRLDSRLDFYQLFDDRPANERTGKTSATRARHTGVKLTERATLELGPRSHLRLNAAVSTVTQRSVATAQLSRTALPFTDRLTEGRQEGHYVIGPYTGGATLDGQPWSFYTRFEWNSRPDFLGLSHEVHGGLELKREWNSGAGYQFDVEFPPQTTFNGVNGFDRPRRFDDLPPLVTSALYLDDRIAFRIGRTVFQLQAGLRADLLHRGSTWFARVRDQVLQPRVNAELGVTRWLRLRAGWGRTAKTPPLSLFAPSRQYYDVVNVNYFTTDPEERLAVLTTFIRDPTNHDLGFARARKLEAGLEIGVGAAAISFVAFNDRITNGFGIRPTPQTLAREHFTLTDSVIGNGVKPDIIEPAERVDPVPVLLYRPDHIHTQTNKGFELAAFLPEIPRIRTRLTVTGQWIETRQRSDALYFGSYSDFSAFQLNESDVRTPYWSGATEVGRRVLLVYRLVHHQPAAGLVISATVQHNVTDEFFDIAGVDTLAFEGYLTREAQLVPVPEAERGQQQYQDLRLPRSGLLLDPQATGADWMLSVQVSKSLPLDGRLNFWAFNGLDRRGQVNVGIETRPRPYPPVRVGLEVMLALRGILGR